MKPKNSKVKRYRPQVLTDFEELPVFIKELATKLMQQSAGDLLSEIEWSIAVIFEVEKLLELEPERLIHQIQNKLPVIPNYSLQYNYKWGESNSDVYSFTLDFDQYGQILQFGLPRHSILTKRILKGKDIALKIAMDYAKETGYNLAVESIKIDDQPYQDGLLWRIMFFQKKMKNAFANYNYCRALMVDVLSKSVVADIEARIG